MILCILNLSNIQMTFKSTTLDTWLNFFGAPVTDMTTVIKLCAESAMEDISKRPA